MNTKQPANMPKALSEARCQLDHWRSQQASKRTRLPKEFWQQAVALAKEHGLNKTARALGLKYYSLKLRPTGPVIALSKAANVWPDGKKEQVKTEY